MLKDFLDQQLLSDANVGIFQDNTTLTSLQLPTVTLADGREVINLFDNDYLGLAGQTLLIEKATTAFEQYSFGLSPQALQLETATIHRELEINLSQFLHVDDAILFNSYFDIQKQLFFSLMGVDDVLICDEANTNPAHLKYKNHNMSDLEKKLRQTKSARYRLIAVAGVSPLDGRIANLPVICALAKKYDALVMVDDTHGVGFMGANGFGTHEYHRVIDQVDILTCSFAENRGNYVAGRKQIIDWLRSHIQPIGLSQKSIITSTLCVLEILNTSEKRIQRLHENELYLRHALTALGFNLLPGKHPIISVLTKNSKLTEKMVKLLLQEGVYTIGITAPIVPENKSRIRMQVSAAHEKWHLDKVADSYLVVGKKLGFI